MADGLKLGLYGLHRGGSADPDTMVRRARLAEEAGFESLWVGDHIALPSGLGDPPDQPRIEAVVALAHMAALTSRVRLCFGVIVLPQRQPVLLAKQLASIDVLSKGRLTVGIGVGYVEPELRALGVSLADRGARTDEYLAVMRALWDEPTPSFEGRFVGFADVVERPRPVQRPPRLGELEITITPPGSVDVETARRYADLGVHRLAIQPHTMDGSAMDELISSVAEPVEGTGQVVRERVGAPARPGHLGPPSAASSGAGARTDVTRARSETWTRSTSAIDRVTSPWLTVPSPRAPKNGEACTAPTSR